MDFLKKSSINLTIKNGMSIKDLQRIGLDIVDTFRLIESGHITFKFSSKKGKPYSFCQLKTFYIDKD